MTSLGSLIILLLQLYNLLIFARAILSFFPTVDPYNPVVKFLYDVTEPVLAPVRELMRQQFPGMMGMDFSPLIVWVIIQVLIRIVAIIF